MDFVFQLLNQYSIAGDLVPLNYNDQADAKNRMLNLINEAQMEIATVAKPIDATFTINMPKVPDNVANAYISKEMPEDFNHEMGIYLDTGNGNLIDANHYKWIGNTLLLPNRPAGKYTILYSRFPARYDSSTNINTTCLDNTPDTHEIIPYFVAAMIAIDENPKAYQAYYNVWETRLARLKDKPVHAVSTQVKDMYGFDNFGGFY